MKLQVAIFVFLLVFADNITYVNEPLYMSTTTCLFKPLNIHKLTHPLLSHTKIPYLFFRPHCNISTKTNFSSLFSTIHKRQPTQTWSFYLFDFMFLVLVFKKYICKLFIPFRFLLTFLGPFFIRFREIGCKVQDRLKNWRSLFEYYVDIPNIILRTLDILISLLNLSEPVPERPIRLTSLEQSEKSSEIKSTKKNDQEKDKQKEKKKNKKKKKDEGKNIKIKKTVELVFASQSLPIEYTQNQPAILLLLHDLCILSNEICHRLKRLQRQQSNNTSNAKITEHSNT